MPSGAMIEVENLTKVYRNYARREGIGGAMLDLFKRRYRHIRAVDGVSFAIARGEIVGYIGANGAGKSTTIKMLTGILQPTSGSIVVNGLVPHRARYAHARQIGVVFGQRTQLWWDLAVIEAFHLLQRIYEIPLERYKQRLEHFIEVLDIREQLHMPVRKLSLGQRMKCDLAASLLHRPPLLFLDEPTIGLDVAVKERIRRFIKYINREEQSTIILTTHDMNDIEELCPRIMLIDSGRILYDGSQQEIKDRFGRWRRVILEFKEDYAAQYATRPLPGPEVPVSFAGLDPVRLERRAAASRRRATAHPERSPRRWRGPRTLRWHKGRMQRSCGMIPPGLRSRRWPAPGGRRGRRLRRSPPAASQRTVRRAAMASTRSTSPGRGSSWPS